MTSHNCLRARAGHPSRFSLRPLCALLAALPFAALAQDAPLQTVTVTAPAPEAQPVGASVSPVCPACMV